MLASTWTSWPPQRTQNGWKIDFKRLVKLSLFLKALKNESWKPVFRSDRRKIAVGESLGTRFRGMLGCNWKILRSFSYLGSSLLEDSQWFSMICCDIYRILMILNDFQWIQCCVVLCCVVLCHYHKHKHEHKHEHKHVHCFMLYLDYAGPSIVENWILD